MDETTYQKLADKTFRAISDAFEHVDPEVVDCEVAGDVVTITLPGSKRCIVNTQRPVRQNLARRERPRLALLVGRRCEPLGRRQREGGGPLRDAHPHREGGHGRRPPLRVKRFA